jgi:hypothetical protein
MMFKDKVESVTLDMELARDKCAGCKIIFVQNCLCIFIFSNLSMFESFLFSNPVSMLPRYRGGLSRGGESRNIIFNFGSFLFRT